MDAATRAAMLCAAAMIAQQIGAKATRDALFLSTFGVEALPTMVMASAAASIVFVIPAGRLLAAWGPARMLSLGFAVSSALLLGVFGMARAAPRAAAVIVYLYVAIFGSVLISVFWSLVGERFDPRTAKTRMAWIAGAGTLGGVLGGLAAERVAAAYDARGVLLLLTALHLSCAWAVGRSMPEEPAGHAAAAAPPPPRHSAARLLRTDRYLRSIAVLVGLLSVGVALMDYLFKTRAVAAYGVGTPLLRFFATFYTATGLLAFVGQVGLSRLALERMGLANTVAAVPLTVAGGGLASLLLPGLGAVASFRGAEAVLRGCFYRPAYELLYTPLPPLEKRAAKTFVDVALDRMGEIAGGLAARLVLAVAADAAASVLSGLVAVIGVASFVVARSLHRGYVHALERSLLSRAVEIDPSEVLDGTTRAVVLVTRGGQPASRHRPPAVHVPVVGAADALDTGLFLLAPAARPGPSGAEVETPGGTPSSPRPPDPILARIAVLSSGDPAKVREALKRPPVHRREAPHAIALLAWNEVSEAATEALQAVGPRIVGQLVDSLLDPDEEFAVRRRVPRVLGSVPSERAVEGLLRGLEDRRFEVRFECARALVRIRRARAEVRIPEETVFAAVLREAAVGPELWNGRQLLDWSGTAGDWSVVDDRLGARSNRSLQHVFALLSLVLPAEPLRVAFRGLYTDEQGLRGTALEYLESILPGRVRDALWPFLEPARGPTAPRRPPAEVLETLLRSSASIEVSLGAAARPEHGGERD